MASLLHQIVALCAAVLLALHSAEAAQFHWHPNEVQGTAWDYIVVGGGLSGLVVSRRLAEEKGTKVLVIEPGTDERKNPDIYKVSKYGAVYDTPLDWAFKTTPQAVIGNHTRKIRGAACWADPRPLMAPHGTVLPSLSTICWVTLWATTALTLLRCSRT